MQVYNTCRYISLLPANLMLIFAEIDIQRCVQDSIKIFCSTPKSATFRQHAREPNKSSNTRPNVSYYSRDYHEQPKSELVRIVWNNSEWQDSIDYLCERNKKSYIWLQVIRVDILFAYALVPLSVHQYLMISHITSWRLNFHLWNIKFTQHTNRKIQNVQVISNVFQ